MNDEFADIWQSQQTTGGTLAVEEIRLRAKRLKTRLGRERKFEVAVWIAVVAMMCGDLLFYGHPWAPWMRAAVVVFYALIFVSSPHKFRKKAATPVSRVFGLNLLATPTPCVEFYRRELEDRLEDLKRARPFAPLMMIAGASLGIVGNARFESASFVPTVVAGWIMFALALFWYLRTRKEMPRLQAELADLAAFSPPAQEG